MPRLGKLATGLIAEYKLLVNWVVNLFNATAMLGTLEKRFGRVMV
jgi:hypothetical protein